MSAIFLSASVPLVGRGTYHETANPFLIQCAVRELAMAVIRRHKIVWGGHPAITPMIWTICEDLGVDYSQSVILYQSKFFEDRYPEENKHFQNVVYTEAIPNDRGASLLTMRERAHEIGGTLVIESAPGQGTRVLLQAPLVDHPLLLG